jgi:hypothetical protein
MGWLDRSAATDALPKGVRTKKLTFSKVMNFLAADIQSAIAVQARAPLRAPHFLQKQ